MLALLALAVTAAQVPLNVISGVHLGDTQEAVVSAWRNDGPISAEPAVMGGTDLKAGSNDATICQGRVVIVSHEMGDDFTVFAGLGEALSQAYGPAKTPEVFAINSTRPATDPRGASNLKLGVIRLRWDSAPHYMLGFSTLNGKSTVVETLAVDNPCAPTR